MRGFRKQFVPLTVLLTVALTRGPHVSSPALAADKIGIETIIVRLKAYEKLYDNHSVHWRRSLRNPAERSTERGPIAERRKGTTPKARRGVAPRAVLMDADEQAFCVTQDGKFFLENKEFVFPIGSGKEAATLTRSVRKAFDGEKTRQLDFDGRHYAGTISQGPAYDGRILNPYVLPIQAPLAIPLSTYLSGADAIRADPRNAAWPLHRMELVASDDGVEETAGLKCHRIVVTVKVGDPGSEARTIGKEIWWLAIARNYLPVKNDSYVYFYARDIPIQSCELSDLKEIARGTWFPFKAQLTVLQQVPLLERKQALLGQTTEWVVTDVSLKPQYERSFLQDVKFPYGTAVQVLDANRNVISSYVQESK